MEEMELKVLIMVVHLADLVQVDWVLIIME